MIWFEVKQGTGVRNNAKVFSRSPILGYIVYPIIAVATYTSLHVIQFDVARAIAARFLYYTTSPIQVGSYFERRAFAYGSAEYLPEKFLPLGMREEANVFRFGFVSLWLPYNSDQERTIRWICWCLGISLASGLSHSIWCRSYALRISGFSGPSCDKDRVFSDGWRRRSISCAVAYAAASAVLWYIFYPRVGSSATGHGVLSTLVPDWSAIAAYMTVIAGIVYVGYMHVYKKTREDAVSKSFICGKCYYKHGLSNPSRCPECGELLSGSRRRTRRRHRLYYCGLLSVVVIAAIMYSDSIAKHGLFIDKITRWLRIENTEGFSEIEPTIYVRPSQHVEVVAGTCKVLFTVSAGFKVNQAGVPEPVLAWAGYTQCGESDYRIDSGFVSTKSFIGSVVSIPFLNICTPHATMKTYAYLSQDRSGEPIIGIDLKAGGSFDHIRQTSDGVPRTRLDITLAERLARVVEENNATMYPPEHWSSAPWWKRDDEAERKKWGW